jgi:hypothetical protein
MNEEIKENRMLEEANSWLKKNGKLSVKSITGNNLEEYKLTFIPDNSNKAIVRAGADSKRLTIDLYKELNG